jgi:hypothetical protein
VAPPDRRREVNGRLPHGCHDLQQCRQAVIIVQRAAVIIADAMRYERRTVIP